MFRTQKLIFIVSLITATVLLVPTATRGAFDVSMWNLHTWLNQQTKDLPVFDGVEITRLSNPLSQVVRAQINSSYNESAFSYQWIVSAGTGTFETDLTHVVRDSRIDMRSIFQVWILPTEDIRLTIDASLAYNHTPGDESGVSLSFLVRNTSTNQNLFAINRLGGNLNLQGSSGVLSISRSDILEAGTTYRLVYGATSANGADFSSPPTGTIDALGHINFSIEPAVVPEPSTFALLLPANLAFLRRPRRHRSIRAQSAPIH